MKTYHLRKTGERTQGVLNLLTLAVILFKAVSNGVHDIGKEWPFQQIC